MIGHPRYPGSPPFADSPIARLLFYGRSDEAARVTDEILSYDLLVVYGVSGTGKSSLLQAGVFQRLRDKGLWPVVVRLNDPAADPVALVGERLAQQATAEGVELLPAQPGGGDLWELLGGVEVWRADELQTPVVVLDQFEELFTLDWDPATRRRFIEQFGWVTRGHRPLETGEDASQPPRVKFVVLIREDSLGELEALSADVPHIMRNRFRLRPLSLDQAEAAIRGPAAVDDERLASPPFRYADDAVDLMLEFLRVRQERGRAVKTDAVEPSQLQIICQHVEEALVGGRDGVVVSAADLGGREGLGRILQEFYGSRVGGLDPAAAAAVRALCETGLINASGRRLSLEVGEIEAGYGVGQALLDRLVAQRLLRADARTGSVYYELAHDSLVAPILAHRAAQEDQERAAVRRRWVRLGAVLVVAIVALSLGSAFFLRGESVSTVTGAITAADGGGLPNVLVEFHVDDPDDGGGTHEVSVATTSDGRFTARLEPDVDYHVRFVADGFQEHWWPDARDFDSATPIRPDSAPSLDVELVGAGSIAFAVGGSAPARVELLRDGMVVEQGQIAGLGLFDELQPASYSVRFNRDGFIPQEFGVGLGAGETHDLGVVALRRPAVVAVEASLPAGQVVVGDRLELTIRVSNTGGEAVTLGDLTIGREKTPAAARLEPGESTELSAPLRAAEAATCVDLPITLSWATAREESRTGAELSYCARRLVSGEVKVGDVAAVDATVSWTVATESGTESGVTQTGEAGEFSFLTLDGEMTVEVRDVADAEEAARRTRVLVGRDQVDPLPDFVFTPRSFTISGTVALSVDRDGAPLEVVPDADVTLCSVACVLTIDTATSGRDGTFTVRAPNGTYGLVVAAIVDGSAYRAAADVVVAGIDVSDLVIVLRPAIFELIPVPPITFTTTTRP